jgi:hypothetical protein
MSFGREFHALMALYENDLRTAVLFSETGILKLYWQPRVL